MPCSISLLAPVLLMLLAGARGAHANATIYRCEVAEVTTFSDRPCGAESTTYVPDVTRVSTYDAPVAGKVSKPARPSARKRIAVRSSIAADQTKHAEQCGRIHASLRDIRAKMRAGYNAKQGERLRDRKAKLEQRRRTQRCR